MTPHAPLGNRFPRPLTPAETIRAADHHSRSDYTLYEGRELIGKVKKVFLRGQCIVDGANWLGHEGAGQFLRRAESGRA